jgi:hypothetical protein
MRIGFLGSVAALMALLSAPAAADSLFDVEHARHNARAGGPISWYDAELLERHGATSGTPDWRGRVVDHVRPWHRYDDRVTVHSRRRLYRR